MLEHKLINTLINIITESKNIGILYHYTDIDSMMGIIYRNILIGREKSENTYSISFTRNKNFKFQTPELGKNLNTRLVVDGNKLSTKFNIIPYASFNYRNYDKKEQEERLFMTMPNLVNCDKYILKYDFYLDEIFNENYYWFADIKKFYLFFKSLNINYSKYNFYISDKLINNDKVLAWIKEKVIIAYNSRPGFNDVQHPPLNFLD
jgi:hypothetical protein